MSYYFEITNNRACAAEILTSAYCNMNCEYCYIPKVKEMADMHREIVDHLKAPKEYIEMLRRTYGDSLEHLSFWGTEPTLILQYMTPNLGLYLEAFPKLDAFSFSSNFLSHTDSIFEFLDGLEKLGSELALKGDQRFKKTGRPQNGQKKEGVFNLSIQISLDGPAYITDVSRQAGATAQIIKNYTQYIEYIAKSDYQHIYIDSHFKPTIDVSHMRDMSAKPEMLDEYFEFFTHVMDVYYDNFDKVKDKLNLSLPSSGTLMVPGKYTAEDGRTFAHYLQKLMDFESHLVNSPKYKYFNFLPSEYLARLERFMESKAENPGYPAQATCSGGDSNFAIDTGRNLHICHRSFYINDQRYLDAIKAANKTENWDVSLFEDGKLQNIQKNYIVDLDDNYERERFVMVMRGFHDYSRFKESFVYGMVQWMAKVGQVSAIYGENDTMAKLFSQYIVYVFGCSIENALNTTSIHLTPVSMIRIFGNGAFELILEEYFKNHPNAEKGGALNV